MRGYGDRTELPAGHYALNADRYDADPAVVAQKEAEEMSAAINLMDSDERTPEAIALVAGLSAKASRLASEANVRLIFGS